MVGKGVTFDTGGISIKPSPGMWEMKCDMAGAATVLAALCAIAVLKLPIKVSAVLCLAENRPGNAAVLPGDIFTAKNGKTIMVDNTDAEGRLILTDGLAEAGALGATHIIDLATLTGAIVRAIGPSIAGLFSNDAGFTQTMFKAGGIRGREVLRPAPGRGIPGIPGRSRRRHEERGQAGGRRHHRRPVPAGIRARPRPPGPIGTSPARPSPPRPGNTIGRAERAGA